MNKEEAKQRLLNDKQLNYDYRWWTAHISGCSMTTDWLNGDGEYDCCYTTFGSVEEAVNHLEEACGGDWEEVG